MWTDENRTGAPHGPRHALARAHEMLGSHPVGQRNRLRFAPRHDDAAAAGETLTRRPFGGQSARHRGRDVTREPAIGSDEEGTRVDVMLGLGDEIGGNPFGRTIIRYDEDFGRTCAEIDAAIA